jgi:GTPase SAR1 family protein
MGVAIEMCTCSSQQAIAPNSKLNVESDGMNLYNSNNNNIKNDNNNNLEQIKKKKKNSNGVIINNEQSNDAETYNNISSNGAVVLTPKQKKESNYSQKIKKRDKDKDKKIKKESDKKDKIKNQKLSGGMSDNDEEYENVNISETVLSELIVTEKIKIIPKEKKKKIKGRNNINIIIIGYNEVGKSSFCIRYVENKFEDFYIPSICKEDFCKMMVYNEHNYKINFSVILASTKIQKQDILLNNADFFLLIYDITKIRSFNLINLYLKQLKKYLYFYDKEGKSPNFCVVGNKSDLEGERKVSIEIVDKCIKKYNIKHFNISIKTGKNINNIIQSFIQIFDKVAFSGK